MKVSLELSDNQRNKGEMVCGTDSLDTQSALENLF